MPFLSKLLLSSPSSSVSPILPPPGNWAGPILLCQPPPSLPSCASSRDVSPPSSYTVGVPLFVRGGAVAEDDLESRSTAMSYKKEEHAVQYIKGITNTKKKLCVHQQRQH
jgi:hypothetical protein